CAKNVGITVSCIECEKLRLLFSAKKISEKDKSLLQRFLDTIFYTYSDNEENINKEVNEKENDSTESESSDDEEPDEIAEESDENIEEPDTVAKDSIYELFLKVFVNNSLTCTTEIEKLYYSARIYPDVCIHCGYLDVSNSANEYPCCNDCESNLANSKKSSRQSKDIKNKRKHIKTKN
ncbi:11234_t:CDS:2, partial [Scutellospora calospora]